MAVYIDEHLQFNHINMEALSNIEALWFEFTPTKSKKSFLAVFIDHQSLMLPFSRKRSKQS